MENDLNLNEFSKFRPVLFPSEEIVLRRVRQKGILPAGKSPVADRLHRLSIANKFFELNFIYCSLVRMAKQFWRSREGERRLNGTKLGHENGVSSRLSNHRNRNIKINYPVANDLSRMIDACDSFGSLIRNRSNRM